MTSSTFTEIARMPGVMVGGRPAPASIGATLEAVSGSFSSTGAIRPRFDDVLDPRVGAGHRTRLGPGHELHVGGREQGAHRQRLGGDGHLVVADLDLAHRDVLHLPEHQEAGGAGHEQREGEDEDRACAS